MPRRAVLSLYGAAAGLLLLAVTWYVAFHVGLFERADQSILHGFVDLHTRAHVWEVVPTIAGLCDPDPYLYLAAIPLVIALIRRRFRLTAAIAGILLGANVTTHLLKPLLAHPRAASLFGGVAPVDAASWPSGHATAAMSLALCTVLAVPSRLRPAASALGALFAVAVSYSFLTMAWHYPSDVFGGFLVAGVWTLLGAAAVLSTEPGSSRKESAIEPAPRSSWSEVLGPPAGILAGAVLLVVLVVFARPQEVVAYARLHQAFVIGAVAIGAFAIAIATGVVVALRR